MIIRQISLAFMWILITVFSHPAGLPRADQQSRDEIEGEQEPRKENNSKNTQRRPGDKQGQKQPAEIHAQTRPLEVLLLINDVRSAPPEFAADLLIRIAQSDKVAEPAWKCELLEEAFRLAATVQQPVKRVSLPSSPTDTRAGFLASAFELGLDALSLECRVVNALLSVDKPKAREMFAQIPKLQLAALDCEDSLVYNVSDYYATLKRIAETTFKPKEIKRNEHVRLVESRLSQMVSPSEVVPALDTVSTINVSSTQRQLLLDSLSSALGKASGDDRCFTASLYYLDQAMKSFIAQCVRQGISRYEVLRSYRAYLIRHLAAARCADNAVFFRKGTQEALIASFNAMRSQSDGSVLEISADDIKPVRVAGSVKAHTHWQSHKASVLLTRIKKLRFGSGKAPLTAAERETLDWQTEMDEFLKDMADWTKEDEQSAEDYFHQKCLLLKALIELAPKKGTRENLISKFVEALNDFDLSRGSRIEWFWQARFLFVDAWQVDGTSSSAPRLVMNKSDTLPIVDYTRNPVLYLYSQVEKLLDKRP